MCCIIYRESNSHYSCRSQTQSIADKNEYIKQISGLLGSKDFKERIKGIDQLTADCQHNPNIVINSIFPVRAVFSLFFFQILSIFLHVLVIEPHYSSVKTVLPFVLLRPVSFFQVFDAFKARLQESNSKVNLYALESLQKIIHFLKDNLSQVVNILVPAIVDNHLNSKNNAIYSAAIGAIDALISNLGTNFRLLNISATGEIPVSLIGELSLTLFFFFFHDRSHTSSSAFLHQGSVFKRQSKGGSYRKGCRYVCCNN